jgi:hypothetical protein
MKSRKSPIRSLATINRLGGLLRVAALMISNGRLAPA